MTALAKDRNTPSRSADRRYFGVAASTVIMAGSLVALNSSGFLVPGSTATTLKAVGRAEEHVDNSAGANAAEKCNAATGVFRFENSADSDLIAITDIGAVCYIVDDQTVAKTDDSASRSVAGTVFDVDAQGVWVKF